MVSGGRMPAVVSITEDDVFVSFEAFVKTVLGTDVEVVRGHDNRVSQPRYGYVQLTEVTNAMIATNETIYVDPGASVGTRKVQSQSKLMLQVDCYGELAANWSIALTRLFRDPFGCKELAPICEPLYATVARMMPLVNGSMQYERRYMFEAFVQYNPVITVSQEFADSLNLTLLNVDKVYPVEEIANG